MHRLWNRIFTECHEVISAIFQNSPRQAPVPPANPVSPTPFNSVLLEILFIFHSSLNITQSSFSSFSGVEKTKVSPQAASMR
ncbi:hypothetical protein PBPRB1955 [Photobacterium profundum SS9]|uniref:Uncharacterized protein n=1 Tax=Photobacterium profundum (strain SS9) TaxID=298386 RepID=Q6LFY0_PHOPR|nr:hypothetical protein PBPRB1955 [Photobacterium profundum SS9]